MPRTLVEPSKLLGNQENLGDVMLTVGQSLGSWESYCFEQQLLALKFALTLQARGFWELKSKHVIFLRSTVVATQTWQQINFYLHN